MKKNIPLFKTVISDEIEKVAIEILRSGQVASGQCIQQLEKKLNVLLNQSNLITLNNMSSALHIALHLSKVNAGDEVLTTAYACMSTNAIISAMGATAVWVDLTVDTVNIDPVLFEKSITSRTKAAIVYHVAGYVGAIEEIAEICKKHGIFLIEDCNNALLATSHSMPAGCFGDFAIYSFYPNRLIHALEGAALACRELENLNKAELLRKFGINLKTFRLSSGEINPESNIEEAGWNYPLSNLNAAIALSQIKNVDNLLATIRSNAKHYCRAFLDIPQIHIIPSSPGSTPSYWVFLILINRRDDVMDYLKSHGINCSSLHYDNSKYSCFNNQSSSLLNTSKIQKTILALPCGWWLDEQDIIHVVDVMQLAVKKYSIEKWE